MLLLKEDITKRFLEDNRGKMRIMRELLIRFCFSSVNGDER